jgi:hypothetical protein
MKSRARSRDGSDSNVEERLKRHICDGRFTLELSARICFSGRAAEIVQQSTGTNLENPHFRSCRASFAEIFFALDCMGKQIIIGEFSHQELICSARWRLRSNRGVLPRYNGEKSPLSDETKRQALACINALDSSVLSAASLLSSADDLICGLQRNRSARAS